MWSGHRPAAFWMFSNLLDFSHFLKSEFVGLLVTVPWGAQPGPRWADGTMDVAPGLAEEPCAVGEGEEARALTAP